MKQAKKWLMSLALIFQVMGCQRARLTPEQIVDALLSGLSSAGSAQSR